MSYDEDFEARGRTLSLPVIVGGLALCAAIGIALFAYASVKTQGAKVGLLETDIRELEGQLESFRLADKELKGRVQGAEGKLRQKDVGQAPLAAKILKSVFTVETDEGFGAGFAGWADADATYVVTAAHVISEVGEQVDVVRNNGSWGADVVGIDQARDLAVLRVSGHPVNAAPLWQKPLRNRPRPGDQLLLVGSPFGLDGTVTSGVVSAVRPKLIQTDAAANPGNSGGPAVDRHGHVVGVLVSGGGENLNFAVPIRQLCATLRDC